MILRKFKDLTKLNTLIKNSDIISININYSKKPRLLNAQRLKYCKKIVWLLIHRDQR